MVAASDNNYLAHWITPDWPLTKVKAFVTTRYGNINQPPFDGFNTADHVGDQTEAVDLARAQLSQWMGWTQQPQWLHQTHGIDLVAAQANGELLTADAVYTDQPGTVCAIHTADCLPIFIASESDSVVALIHAGWRGLAAGILANTVQQLPVLPEQLWVWLGPAIGPAAFEVGEEVRSAMVQLNSAHAQFFTPNHRGRWQCDLYGIAREEFRRLGCHRVTGGDFCTFTDPRFFSYRRDQRTGRMLSMIWLDADQ